jgi:hypothetical protein
VTDDVFLERASVHRCLAEILVRTAHVTCLFYCAVHVPYTEKWTKCVQELERPPAAAAVQAAAPSMRASAPPRLVVSRGVLCFLWLLPVAGATTTALAHGGHGGGGAERGGGGHAKPASHSELPAMHGAGSGAVRAAPPPWVAVHGLRLRQGPGWAVQGAVGQVYSSRIRSPHRRVSLSSGCSDVGSRSWTGLVMSAAS